ncbi:phosphate ABC transporter permease PstA [Coralliovum pocilloporae]|uniref:phosphate ABC transporter permease PstA n=1 Tax=Coralliovum pocilloporae TaxID=3066369 RepID=UPI003D9C4618
MTDMANQAAPATHASGANFQSDAARRHLARRYARERRFRLLGMSAVLVAVLFLAMLLSTVVFQGIPAFTSYSLSLTVNVPKSEVDPEGTGDPAVLRRGDYELYLKQAMAEALPFKIGRKDRRLRNGLISSGAGLSVRDALIADPSLMDRPNAYSVPLSDFADLYFKGLVTDREMVAVQGTLSPTVDGKDAELLSTSSSDFAAILDEVKDHLAGRANGLRQKARLSQLSEKALEADLADYRRRLADADAETRETLEGRIERADKDLAAVKARIANHLAEADKLDQKAADVSESLELDTTLPSYLIRINDGVVRLNQVSAAGVKGEVLIPLSSDEDAAAVNWTMERLVKPESNRKLSDKEIVWLDHLKSQNLVSYGFNTTFFSAGASREPELAGIWGAIVGSFLTMVVTLLLAFPLGVAAAIYLEEFAPKNRWTQLIEVNINNLAAVPSIVFGLLGLAVFLNVFHLPRSAPIVGGMVLALMTLPTIIIAARAALKAVPPSIREAALGIGASRIQTVFHHVLPLAMPGILTGTIIGMAQALGETAPLLMIGMVAFIVDIPAGPLDPATVLPVQIFMWADFPEIAFQQKTAAAIMILLGFLILMNALAVVLRKRFERRW